MLEPLVLQGMQLFGTPQPCKQTEGSVLKKHPPRNIKVTQVPALILEDQAFLYPLTSWGLIQLGT